MHWYLGQILHIQRCLFGISSHYSDRAVQLVGSAVQMIIHHPSLLNIIIINEYHASNVVILLNNVSGVLYQEALFCSIDIFLELLDRDIGNRILVTPLEIKLEIIADIVLNVEFVDCHAVSYIHCEMGKSIAIICWISRLIVSWRNQIIGLF